MHQDVVERLISVVGEQFVSTQPATLLTYSKSASMSYDSHLPGAVVRPANTQEVAEIVKIANEFKIPVTPRSGGSSLQGEVLPQNDAIVIDLLRLTDLHLYKDLRSVTVGAGVTFGMLDKFLQPHDLWVPIYPESSLVCTLAGNVAVNGAGPGSSRYGCIGELVLGLEVVLPNGKVIKTGSEANPHAPGPYLRYAFGPDLTGLFIGSLGTLGIITKVSIKTFRRMHYFHYETYGFNTIDSCERFLIELKQHEIHPLFASIYEGRILQFFMDMLGEEYGIPTHQWPPYVVSATLGRLREDMLQSDVTLAKNICEDLDGHVIGISELPRGEWEDRMRVFVRSSYVHGWHWRILYHHQTPANWHKSVEAIWQVMDKYGILGHTAGFQSGHSSYNFYPHLYYFPDDPEEKEKVRKAHKELARILLETGAVPFKLSSYWIEGMASMKPYLRMIQSIKRVLDPNNIMNPGILPVSEA